jgi:serine/threonine-protein kinase
VGKYTAPAQQPVPNVVGMPLDKAQAALSQAKLNAAVTMQPVDQPQRNNVVLAQNVPAGKTLPPGSMMPIVVGRYTAPAQQPVPNATGMKAETARQMFEKQGWKVNIEERPVGDSRQAGMVLQQVPPPGTQVQQKNQPVTLVVGKAQETVQVPQVAGMKLQEAQAALAKVKLNAQVSSQPVANPQQNGVVIGQRVAPGTTVAPGSMVPVTVGAYTAPARPAVPNVTGMPVAEAQKTLAAGRLNAVVSLENVTDQGKKGIVLKQQIAAGTALDPGSQVPLVVGRYVEPLRVPSVVGMKGEQAKAVLEQAKLKMNAGARTVQDRTKIGTVLDQNPAPGTAVEPGSQVIVTMGLDPNKKINLPPSNPYSPYNPPIPADGTSSRK